MEMMVLGAFVLVALTLQLFATWRLRGSNSYASEQKSAQLKLIWLLPVAGAVFAAVFHRWGGRSPEGNLLDRVVRGIPMGHVAQAEDVARLVLYLASDDSRYSTGSEFVVDGGMTA